jgi:hypothetical protein
MKKELILQYRNYDSTSIYGSREGLIPVGEKIDFDNSVPISLLKELDIHINFGQSFFSKLKAKLSFGPKFKATISDLPFENCQHVTYMNRGLGYRGLGYSHVIHNGDYCRFICEPWLVKLLEKYPKDGDIIYYSLERL